MNDDTHMWYSESNTKGMIKSIKGDSQPLTETTEYKVITMEVVVEDEPGLDEATRKLYLDGLK